MLRLLIGLLVLFWIIGFAIDIAGGLIHFLLVIALICFIIDFIQGRNKG